MTRKLLWYSVSQIIAVFLFIATALKPVYCQENTDKTLLSVQEDSCSLDGENRKSVSIQSSIVFPDKFDTGFGFGAGYRDTIFKRSFGIATVIHYWGASADNTDISVGGIDESLVYRFSLYKRLIGFTGITCGYYYRYEKINAYREGMVIIKRKKNNSFEAFITCGLEYTLPTNRSVFCQFAYGSNKFSKESHITIGFNFFPEKKVNNEEK